MSVVVTQRDNGARVFAARLREANKSAVDVGVLGAKASATHAGTTTGEIASYHEFGIGVPQRSFVRGWVDENRLEVSSLMRRVLSASVEGMPLDKALTIAGLKIASGMQERISSGIAPALQLETVKRKGSSTPLVDTGQLRSSIAPRVVK